MAQLDFMQLALSEITPAKLLERVDLVRSDAARRLDPQQQAILGQFLTPSPVARLMASLFVASGSVFRFLDAGAGTGSLSAALVAELCSRRVRPERIEVTAFEVDPLLADYLRETFALCEATCEAAGISFAATVETEDFVCSGVYMLIRDAFDDRHKPEFHGAILNPPYKKINSNSHTRKLLRRVGMETSNLYAAFVAVAGKLLAEHGELVAITPRSFCNGSYFRPFRDWLLSDLALTRFHVFESRTSAFRDDGVLQENVIFRAVRGADQPEVVTVSASADPLDEASTQHEVPINRLVLPNDPDRVIHLVADELGHWVAERMARFTHKLDELGLGVSTGRVVDFRADGYLRTEMGPQTVPLVYPGHFDGWYVAWPKPNGRKANALAIDRYTAPQTVPGGVYVLTKRFSAKEERRRVVAAIYDPERVGWCGPVGFENHVNYFHEEGSGLPLNLAKGLAAFLNSTLVDEFFRQFNGHTQVNATDLRSLGYPDRLALQRLGARLADALPDQHTLDALVDEEFGGMPDDDQVDPVQAKRRIDEARDVLAALGFPKQQLQERSALTLLALLDIRPGLGWSDARDPLIGISPMMDFFREHYGKSYAPNSRETVRRQTVHQFLDAGLIVSNPDKPDRATNSGQTVYQVEQGALGLLRTYGSPDWEISLQTYLASRETLAERYAQERRMKRIPIVLNGGNTLTLSPGGQNVLVEQIVNEFCSRFTPGADLLYVGDTDEKWAYFNREKLADLGITIAEHGKMPDVIVFHRAKDWLVLVEAVTSHGPVNPKRHQELQALFAGAKVGVVYVTAFLSRQAMVKYLGDIAWETEVWVADAPSHLIHFNGERFLGPY
jgi:adenine-specific DNA-methyltransferase